MKKFLALLTALSLLFAFSSCGEKEEGSTTAATDNETTQAKEETTANTETPSENEETPTTESPAPELPDLTGLAVGEWANKEGSFAAAVKGAELFDDEDGAKAIRIYIDFLNKAGSYTTSYADEIDDVVLTQNDEDLSYTYAVFGEDVAEFGNDLKNIRPGVTIRVVEEYALSEETGTVKFALGAPNQDNDVLSYEFDLTALPGAPETFTPAPIKAPSFNMGLPDSGKVTDYYDDEVQHDVTIANAEFVESRDDEKLIRVTFNFTNNSTEAIDISRACDIRIFQDGIQLEESSAKDVSDAERIYFDACEPGATVTVANSYELISDSPVEVEVYDTWNDAGLAKLFTVG